MNESFNSFIHSHAYVSLNLFLVLFTATSYELCILSGNKATTTQKRTRWTETLHYMLQVAVAYGTVAGQKKKRKTTEIHIDNNC